MEVKFIGKLNNSSRRSGTKELQLSNGTFFMFKNLRNIAINACTVKRLPENLLKNLKSLKDVDLSVSKIEFIPENFFLGNEKLEEINTEENKFKILPENLLKKLKLLKNRPMLMTMTVYYAL